MTKWEEREHLAQNSTSSIDSSFFRPVFDEVSKELGVEDKNPFGEEEEDDEYDSSGKNPFAE